MVNHNAVINSKGIEQIARLKKMKDLRMYRVVSLDDNHLCILAKNLPALKRFGIHHVNDSNDAITIDSCLCSLKGECKYCRNDEFL